MTRTQISAIAIAFSALFTGQAMAADNGAATRAQVKTELAEAIQAGNMVFDEGGQLYREAFPQNYPTAQTETKSRAEVRAELAQAINNGDMLFDEGGQRYSDVFPHTHSANHVASKSREQVRAELAEAIATGAHSTHVSA
ncbi:MAG: DUF4148 domain-containing protein [Alcaligenaceae bacterium]|nr:DUF4148 domain-containing protein [Alcaligenaceae bacterium]